MKFSEDEEKVKCAQALIEIRAERVCLSLSLIKPHWSIKILK